MSNVVDLKRHKWAKVIAEKPWLKRPIEGVDSSGLGEMVLIVSWVLRHEDGDPEALKALLEGIEVRNNQTVSIVHHLVIESKSNKQALKIMKYLLLLFMFAVCVPAHADMNFDNKKLWANTDFAYRLSIDNLNQDNRTVYFFTSYSCKFCQPIDRFLRENKKLFGIDVMHIPVDLYQDPRIKTRHILPIEVATLIEIVKGKIDSTSHSKLDDYLYQTYVPLRNEYFKNKASVDSGVFEEKLIAAKNSLDAYLVKLGVDLDVINKTRKSFAVQAQINKYIKIFRSRLAFLEKSKPTKVQRQRFGNSVPALHVGDEFILTGKFLGENALPTIFSEIRKDFH